MKEFMPECESRDDLEKSAALLCGIGLRGDTCGVAVGGSMFLGLLYGECKTEVPLEVNSTLKYLNKIGVITKYAQQFEDKLGSTQCRDVHKDVMGGTYYDLSKPAELLKFYGDGAAEGCQAVVETGVRLICDLIMDEDGNIKKR